MLTLGGRAFCGCHPGHSQCFLLLMETLCFSGSLPVCRMRTILDARNVKYTGRGKLDSRMGELVDLEVGR